MQTIMIVCAVFATAAIVTGTVYFILTMVQFRKTAKEFEGIAKMMNLAAPFMKILFFGGGILSMAAKKIKNAIKKI